MYTYIYMICTTYTCKPRPTFPSDAITGVKQLQHSLSGRCRCWVMSLVHTMEIGSCGIFMLSCNFKLWWQSGKNSMWVQHSTSTLRSPLAWWRTRRLATLQSWMSEKHARHNGRDKDISNHLIGSSVLQRSRWLEHVNTSAELPKDYHRIDCKLCMASDLRNASFIVASRFPLRDADELLRLVGPTQDRCKTLLPHLCESFFVQKSSS